MPFVEFGNRRLLYLHVPRTGGSTIEAWLRTLSPMQLHSVGNPVALHCTPQHLRMSDIRSLFSDGYFDHVVMTVRNPYMRIESEYRMHVILGKEGFWGACPDFSLWLENTLSEAAQNAFLFDNHLRPQWEFLGDEVEVLRYEDGLDKAVARIAAMLGIEAPETLDKIYGTVADGITVNWDVVDILRVQDFYRKDFEVFGYDLTHPRDLAA